MKYIQIKTQKFSLILIRNKTDFSYTDTKLKIRREFKNKNKNKVQYSRVQLQKYKRKKDTKISLKISSDVKNYSQPSYAKIKKNKIFSLILHYLQKRFSLPYERIHHLILSEI